MHCMDLSVQSWSMGGEDVGGNWKRVVCSSVLKYSKRLKPTSWLSSYLFSLSDVHTLLMISLFHSVQKWCARHIMMLLWKWSSELCVNTWKTLVLMKSNTHALYDYYQRIWFREERLNHAGICMNFCIYAVFLAMAEWDFFNNTCSYWNPASWLLLYTSVSC